MTNKSKRHAEAPVSGAGKIDPAFLPIVDAFSGYSDVARRRMFSSESVLSAGGKIFAMMVRGEFVAKLPAERVTAIIDEGGGHFFDPGHGRLMKEWIALDGDRASWLDLAYEAYRFVRGSDNSASGRGRNAVQSPRRKGQTKRR